MCVYVIIYIYIYIYTHIYTPKRTAPRAKEVRMGGIALKLVHETGKVFQAF